MTREQDCEPSGSPQGRDEASKSSPPAGELERFLSQQAFIMPNLNDTFAYACADTEKLSVGDGDLLAAFWRKYGWQGLVAIAAVRRRQEPLPQVAAYKDYQLARAELLAQEDTGADEDGEPWTLLDEFELPTPELLEREAAWGALEPAAAGTPEAGQSHPGTGEV